MLQLIEFMVWAILTILFPCEGCLLDNATRPPDVPPRNPTMNRLNGRLATAPSDPSQDFEPSCLVRTPSGNVYIPTGTLNMPKNSTMDYKSNSSCSSPSKDLKNSERCTLPYGTPVPVLPVRHNLRRPNSSHFPPASRFHFRKGIASKCTWKCTAIVFIMVSVVLIALLSYISASTLLNWSYQSSKACTVLVGENPEVFPVSKTSPSETNLSISSRPRPSSGGSGNSGGSGGGNDFIEDVDNNMIYIRKRRQVNNTEHASLVALPEASEQSAAAVELSSTTPHVDSIFAPLHDDINVGDDVLLKNVSVAPRSDSDNRSEEFTTELFVEDEADPETTSLPTPRIEDIPQEPFSESDTPDNDFTTTESDAPESVAEPENLEDLKAQPLISISNSTTSTNTTDDDVVKVLPESSEKLSQEPPSAVQEAKSSSEDVGGADVQQDYPSVYSYGQEELEIVGLDVESPPSIANTKHDPNKNGSGEHWNENAIKKVVNSSEDTSAELTSFNLAAVNKGGQSEQDMKDKIAINTEHESDLLTTKSPVLSNPKNSTDIKPNTSPNVKIIEIPPMNTSGSGHSKRVLVNVTIATEPDPGNNFASQSVYVLSVSVPTDGGASDESNPHGFAQQSFTQNHAVHRSPPLSHVPQIPSTVAPYNFWGGECKCSCPCLEESQKSVSATPTPVSFIETDYMLSNESGNFSEYDGSVEEDGISSSSPSNTDLTFNSSSDPSSTTERWYDNETSSSEGTDFSSTSEATEVIVTACPEMTTALPPPPTILILEGNIVPF